MSRRERDSIPNEELGAWFKFCGEKENQYRVGDMWDEAKMMLHTMSLREAIGVVRFISGIEDGMIRKFRRKMKDGQ